MVKLDARDNALHGRISGETKQTHTHTVEQNILITLFNNNNQPEACPAVPINQFPLFLAPQVLLVPLPGPPGPLPRHEEEYVEYGFKLSCKMCEGGCPLFWNTQNTQSEEWRVYKRGVYGMVLERKKSIYK